MRLNTSERIIIVLLVAKIAAILYSFWQPLHPALNRVSTILTLLLVYLLWTDYKRKKQAKKNE
ncbi:MAG: hypothetical protein LBU80_06610 [Rikenellaceae bacterium]|nr:hypothetical protein [Rikenellaceae bacterium]